MTSKEKWTSWEATKSRVGRKHPDHLDVHTLPGPPETLVYS